MLRTRCFRLVREREREGIGVILPEGLGIQVDTPGVHWEHALLDPSS